jgi:hypothetical protein
VRPARRPQGRQGPGRKVLAVDAGTDDLVAVRLLDLDQIGEGQGLEERDELVQAVLPLRPEVEAEVELGGGFDSHVD